MEQKKAKKKNDVERWRANNCGDDNNTAQNQILVTFQFLFIWPAWPVRQY